jgi:hypothetical protein
MGLRARRATTTCTAGMAVYLGALLWVIACAADAPAKESSPAEKTASEAAAPVAALADDLNAAKLDEEKWALTKKHDFAEAVVDVTPILGKEGEGGLRFRCGTIGTDDRTVKFLGVASRVPLDLSRKKSLSVDVDWNNQANGCYMTMSVILCPTLTADNPEDELDWLKVE